MHIARACALALDGHCEGDLWFLAHVGAISFFFFSNWETTCCFYTLAVTYWLIILVSLIFVASLMLLVCLCVCVCMCVRVCAQKFNLHLVGDGQIFLVM